MAKHGDDRDGQPRLFLLRQEPGRGAQADRGPDGLHLRRVHRPLQRHHRRGVRPGRGARVDLGGAEAGRDQEGPRPVRDRPGARQEDPRGRGPQPLQAHRLAAGHRRRRAAEVEHPADRADRLGQDAARADAGALPPGAVRDRRRHQPHRGRLRRRGRREHHPQPAAERRLRRREVRSAASSTSTRSTRSRARATTRRSPATSRARACSRRCSRSSRARRPACRPRAAASTRSRSSSRSTPRTSCSSAAAPSSGSTTSSAGASA